MLKGLNPVLSRFTLQNNPLLIVTFSPNPWNSALLRSRLNLRSLRPDLTSLRKGSMRRQPTHLKKAIRRTVTLKPFPTDNSMKGRGCRAWSKAQASGACRVGVRGFKSHPLHFWTNHLYPIMLSLPLSEQHNSFRCRADIFEAAFNQLCGFLMASCSLAYIFV